MNPDIIIPLGTGSKFRNQELRFSLRSIEKHLKNYRDIYIITDKLPPYINPEKVKFIYHDEYEARSKEKRIMQKFQIACNTPEVSQKFIMWNDDFFIIKDIDAQKIKYYYDTNLEIKVNKRSTDDIYKAALINTLNDLSERGLPINHYDIHYPMYYDKSKFPEIMNMYNWDCRAGYIIKSLYANTLKVKGIYKKDCKIYVAYERKTILNYIKDTDLFSTEEISRAIATLLNEMYPDKSIYEL